MAIRKQVVDKLFTPLRYFFNDSRSAGVVLIFCTALSLILANSSTTSSWYVSFWASNLTLPFSLHLPENGLLWINDGLMTFFFFLVGMEIKRELTIGELASVKKSLLPIVAALGGMLVPALFFFLFNRQTPFHHGWGIPMATDIAFSLGVLSLLGKRVPVQLKIFLAALAIIDDLGAVVTIALFYSQKINLWYLAGGAGALGLVFLFNRLKVKFVHAYWLPAIVLWYCMLNSGIHATIAGVLMAFCMPLFQLSKLEKGLFHPVNFVIMPLFALANTAIALPSSFNDVYTSPISFGVILGLVLGKPIGIFLFSFVASRLKIAALPRHTGYRDLLGVGMVGGIGFTMSIFTSGLSYASEELQVISKVSVITASVVAGVLGFVYLNRLYRNRKSSVVSFGQVSGSSDYTSAQVAV